jgi:hypothetical protein
MFPIRYPFPSYMLVILKKSDKTALNFSINKFMRPPISVLDAGSIARALLFALLKIALLSFIKFYLSV